MKRDTSHVLNFFLAELGTTGSIDGSDRLLVRGKYQPKYVESLLRKYIKEYVVCAMCHSLNTDLTRDNISRLYFMNCKACGSARSVAAIKAGFHATAKGERKKAREANLG
jgi:translation initiation factor 2 subunit 2